MDFKMDEDGLPSEPNEESSTYRRRALALIWVVAAGFLVVGGMDIAAYWLKCRRNQVDINTLHCLYLSLPIVIGVAIMIMSSAIARRIEEYLDE